MSLVKLPSPEFTYDTNSVAFKNWISQLYRYSTTFNGAIAYLTATESINDITDTNIPWDAVVYDTNGFWIASSPTRFTCNFSGRVRVSAGVIWSANSVGYRRIRFLKNAASFYGTGFVSQLSNGAAVTVVQNITSAIVTVNKDDYFQLSSYQNSGGALSIANDYETWFSIEVINNA